MLSHCTRQLPRNAMIRMPANTMPMTCQVLPNVSPISVMPLVSISMKPTPRKKNDRWLKRGASATKFPTSSTERSRICTIMIKYETG